MCPTEDPPPPRENVLRKPPRASDMRTIERYAIAGVRGIFSGYRHAEVYLGRDASLVADEVRARFVRTGAWTGTFEELRVTLFLAARGWRHMGFVPDGEEAQYRELLATLRRTPMVFGHASEE